MKKEFSKFSANLTSAYEEYEELGEKYNVNPKEIAQIDLNRSGIYLPNNEVPENFRVRFKGELLDNYESWFALPVRAKEDTPFKIDNNKMFFKDMEIGNIKDLMLDTCEASYQRGPHLLNLNSRSRSNCGGCKACVHNYKDLYDSTVIKDHVPLNTEEDIRTFLANKNIDIPNLVQIAVVTGLFHGEQNVIDHMKLIQKVTTPQDFNGELMYFGCEVNSAKALEELSKIDNFALIYALDNFSKRDTLLTKTKSLITLQKAKDTLLYAKELGIDTTIAYISGIDSIEEMKEGFNYLKDSFTRFPVINVYQTQTPEQTSILNDEARFLEYYVKSRVEIEDIFKDTSLKPKRWENYRPLWYQYYAKEKLPNNSYGQQEAKKLIKK